MFGVVAVVVVVAALLIAAYALVFRGAVRVEESAVVARPPAEVFAVVADFQTWQKWTPWLMHDLDAKVEFSQSPAPNEVGGFYSWDSSLVGAGKATHIDIAAAEHIEIRLDFVRPFKSSARVFFSFAPAADAGGEGAATKVSWRMESQMPFLLRPLAKLIARQCAMDFGLGLARLAGLVDAGANFPQIDFLPVAERSAVRALAARRRLALADFAAEAAAVYPALLRAVKTPAGEPLMAYRKMRGEKFVVDIAVPVGADFVVGDGAGGAGDFTVEEYAGGKFFPVRLTGEYAHLKFAWHAAFSHLRMRKFKFDPRRLPLEVYENNPNEVSAGDCRTVIYLPVK